MTKLGRGVDELKRDLLEVTTGCVDLVRLADRQNTLLDTRAAALDHDEVVLNNTVVGEATHGRDRLLSSIKLRSTRSLVSAVTNAVNLLVQLSAVVVTILTRASHREHNVSRVPSTNTSHLTKTLVSLTRQLRDTPTSSYTFVTLTLRHTDDINVLVLSEKAVHINSLLEEAMSKVNLVRDRAAVHLNLHEVGLLLLQTRVTELSVGKHANNAAVLANALELSGNRLAVVLRVLLGVLSERLPLATVPVLVEATLHLVREVLSPNSGERTETAGRLDIADNTDHNHRGGFDNCRSLNNLTLVELRAGTVKVTNNVGHASLEAHEGSKVDRLLRVILGE